ncbi:hypothetical protein [Butyrivibrio sp.]|uniref:hypothetical protein n=1 Tax=Butyrivibrio sp. TaxID=28121 RepID=UPI0025BDE745|nr:hypothetical protein [Butyrivibrio sp.]MBQ9302331.1 hypothetical protein [Butyrivibrio sp.]
MRNKNKTILILVIGILLILISIIVIISILSKQEQSTADSPAFEDTQPQTNKITVLDDSTHKPQDFIPKSRDNYIHFESIPGDGLYETLTEEDVLGLSDVTENVIKSLINRMYIQQEYDSAKYIFQYQSANSTTYWYKLDDFYWRFKYFNDSQKVTADGEMSDFLFADAPDFDIVYRENTNDLSNIDHALVVSLANTIMEEGFYDSCTCTDIMWSWDDDDANNHEMFIYILNMKNSTYNDYWAITYVQDQYIEAHRDITGIQQ